MAHDAEPVVGNWYRHADKGQSFSVIEVDEERLRVGLQYFDGDLDELDLDDWYELDVLPIDPPEDWTGPIDTLEPDELDTADSGGEVQGWEVPSDDDRRSKTGAEKELPRDLGQDNRAEESRDEEEPQGREF